MVILHLRDEGHGWDNVNTRFEDLVNRLNICLALSQDPYINKILEYFHMYDCKLIDTFIARGETLNPNMCPKAKKEQT